MYRPQSGARLRDGRWAIPEQVRPLLRAPPRANLGVGLLNVHGLLHNGEAFAAGSQPRRFLHLALSKCDPPYPW
ncbi:hypothetical protein [Xanthomonas theicola]|uniref:Uncharacterized protein n=1 Tax=Xanthomonas theicola TaxID=56464 RepID=A0A2S6ZKD4_9XANT|nr:hypothetical protein [Xanthomonas theicola]PPT92656.1 hypothetical protein XthCFBP4691_03175 [Xanthomonas theicola]QNH26149.1 hypothetical protein G4Q83_17325 [Xanthomonas theicola]